LVLVGNKVDLADINRQVSTEEAIQYAKDTEMLFFETSAYDATNVTKAFETMFSHVYNELSKTNSLKKGASKDEMEGRRTVTLRPPSYYDRKKIEEEKERDNSGCCN
jgi:GTPase SAR1 family protein